MSATVSRTSALAAELRLTAKLGMPLALGELGWMSTYLVDALVIGRLPDSARAIAASSLGNTLFYAIAFFVISLLNGLETLVAQAFGRDDLRECTALLVQGLWIVMVGAPLVVGLTFAAATMLPALGVSADVAAETSRYLRALVWSTPPLLGYMALRRWLQSMNRVGFVTLSLLVASPINLAADWVLVFGRPGMPGLGVVGSGYATAVVRWAMLLIVGLGVWRAFRAHRIRLERTTLVPSLPRLRALLRLGWPTAIESTAELGVSTYASILGRGRRDARLLLEPQARARSCAERGRGQRFTRSTAG